MRRLTTDQFINNARAVHGDLYSYEKVNYINNSTKVDITCPIHGSFMQIPRDHVNSQTGCPLCGGNIKLTTDQFIKNARAVHGDLYSYESVRYVDSHTKVDITCPIHGVFMQTPTAHVSRATTCPQCVIARVTSPT